MRNDGFRDRTKAFALRIVKMYCRLPKTRQAQVLGKSSQKRRWPAYTKKLMNCCE